MIKTKAGERKRTVTVVIGPRTAEILDKVAAEHATRNPGWAVTWTDIAGVSLDLGLSKFAWDRGVLPSSELVRHFE